MACGSLAPAAPVLDAADKRVVDRLTVLLKQRVKKPNGENINLLIVPTARASEGYFSHIRMSGSPAQLKKKLRVSEFSLDARNVRVKVPLLWSDDRVRTFSSQTTLRAVITEDDLTHLLSRGKRTKDMGLKIKFLGDRVAVTGNINYMLVNGPISGIAKMKMMPGHKINLQILSMKLRGVEVPQMIKNQFENHINPMIDYEDLPFNPPFKSVKVVGKKAYIST
jgi:hypothetical protein